MERTFWLVNVPHAKYGYSFMVKYEAKDEDEVYNELSKHMEWFEEAEDYEYANVVEADSYDYEAFKDHILEM